MSTEVVVPETLLDVQTGEVLPATIDNAAIVLASARTMKELINDVVRSATDYLHGEASRQGAKTFHIGMTTITLSGGESIEYDAADLADLLRNAGCPEDRIDAAITAEVTYKVNRSVLRQLAAANPDYKAAIELAERRIEKPYRATLKGAA